MGLPKTIRRTYYVVYISSGSSLSSEIFSSEAEAERRKLQCEARGYRANVLKRSRLEIIGDG